MQETTIMGNVMAKTDRLLVDSKYAELNRAGFPEMADHSAFVRKDGSLRPKFEVQADATRQMAENVMRIITGEEGKGPQLGQFVIERAGQSGFLTVAQEAA
jgi:hypothetical protein